MFKRIFAVAAAASLSVLGATAAAQAQAQPHARPAAHLHGVRVVNLHRAFEAQLRHTKVGKISGIAYARGHRPKAAAGAAASCTEPACPVTWQGGDWCSTPRTCTCCSGARTGRPTRDQEASATYLENFFSGLGDGQSQDNWSTITSQYADGTGAPGFSGLVYEGAFEDTSTPPSQYEPGPDRRRGGHVRREPGDHRPHRRDDHRGHPVGHLPAGLHREQLQRRQHAAQRLRLLQLLQRAVHQPAVRARRDHDVRRGLHQPDDRDLRRVQPLRRRHVRRHDHGPVRHRLVRHGHVRRGRRQVQHGLRPDARHGQPFAVPELWSNAAGGCVQTGAIQDSIKITSPGNQSTNAGAAVNLPIVGTSSAGNPLALDRNRAPGRPGHQRLDRHGQRDPHHPGHLQRHHQRHGRGRREAFGVVQLDDQRGRRQADQG